MDTSQKIQKIKDRVKNSICTYVKITNTEHVDRIYNLLINNNVYEPETGIESLYMAFYYRLNKGKYLLYSQLAHEKGNAFATNNLAIFYEKKDIELSEKLYSIACEMKCWLAFNCYAQFLFKGNRTQEAKKILYQAIELFPKKVDLYIWLARICFYCPTRNIVFDVESCEKLYLIAYSHNPKKMITYLIDFYYKYKTENEVITLFNTHCSKFPEDVSTLINRYYTRYNLFSKLIKHNYDEIRQRDNEIRKKDDEIRNLEFLVEHYKFRPQGYLDAKKDFENRISRTL